MGAFEKETGQVLRQGQGEHGPPEPRDLIDFYQRWPDFRPMIATLAGRSELSSAERQTLHWLVLLVDRISEHDIKR